MSHIWVSHVTHMSESCHTYEWVMSHIWMIHVTHIECRMRVRLGCAYRMSHVTHMHVSFHTYEWVMSHLWVRHVTHMNESCHTYRMRDSGAFYMCDVNHSYVWHDSLIYVTWLIRMWDMTHSVCVTWMIDNIECTLFQSFITLRESFIICNTIMWIIFRESLQHTATHCNTLQHAATHCNTLQHTATQVTHS